METFQTSTAPNKPSTFNTPGLHLAQRQQKQNKNLKLKLQPSADTSHSSSLTEMKNGEEDPALWGIFFRTWFKSWQPFSVCHYFSKYDLVFILNAATGKTCQFFNSTFPQSGGLQQDRTVQHCCSSLPKNEKQVQHGLSCWWSWSFPLLFFLRGEGTILMISDFRLKYLPALISAADQGHRHSAAPNTGIPISHYQPRLCTSIALLSKISQEEQIHYPSLSQHLSQTLAALLPHRPPQQKYTSWKLTMKVWLSQHQHTSKILLKRKEMAGPFLIVLSPLLL